MNNRFCVQKNLTDMQDLEFQLGPRKSTLSTLVGCMTVGKEHEMSGRMLLSHGHTTIMHSLADIPTLATS